MLSFCSCVCMLLGFVKCVVFIVMNIVLGVLSMVLMWLV